LGTTLRAELRSQFGYHWNSMIVGELTVNNRAALLSYVAEYAAFSAPQKADWVTADGSTPVEIDKGAILYACASAVFDMASRMAFTVTLTQPAAANAATVGAEWTDNI